MSLDCKVAPVQYREYENGLNEIWMNTLMRN